MTHVYLCLEQLVPAWFMSATLLLAVGFALMLAARQPAARQRIGELTVLAAVGWLLLAILPFRPGAVGDGRPRLALAASRMETPFSINDPEPTVAQSQPGLITPVVTNDQSPVSLQERTEVNHPSWSISSWFVRLYLGGVALSVVVMLAGKLLLVQIVRAGTVPPDWLLKTYAAMPGARKARIVLTRRGLPFSCGLWRPTIVLPRSLVSADSVTRLNAVLLHEQAHVERWDVCGHAILNVALPLLYFHPLYWLLRRQTLFARERIADSWASQRTDRVGYVESLTQLVRLRTRRLLQPLGVIGMSRFRSSFCRRMDELLCQTVPLATRSSRVWNVVAVALLTIVAFVSWGASDQPGWAQQAVEPVSEVSDPDGPSHAEIAESPVQPSSQPVPVGYTVACVVRPNRTVVYAAVDGTLGEVTKAGQRVTKGAVIASLDDAEVQAQLEQLVAKMESEKIRVQSTTAIDLAKAHVKEREAELALLLQHRLGPDAPETIDPTQLAAQARVQQAQLEVERAVDDARVANYQLRATEKQIRLVKHMLARHTVRAPHAGVIVNRRHVSGQYVSRGDTICSIQRMEQVHVDAAVSLQEYQPDSKRVRVIFQRSNNAIELDGDIVAVAPEVSVEGTVLLTALLHNVQTEQGDWLLLPGMQGVLAFLTQDTRSKERKSDVEPVEPALSVSTPLLEPRASAQPANVEALAELIEALTQLGAQTRLQYEHGATELRNLEKVEMELALAKGRMAEAQGDLQKALASYQSAMEHAERWVQAAKTSMQHGHAPMDVVVEALNQRARMKYHFIRIEQLIHE